MFKTQIKIFWSQSCAAFRLNVIFFETCTDTLEVVETSKTSEISPGPPPFVGILKGRFENGGLMVG